MKTFWLILYAIIAIFLIFLLPTSIYLYESDETKPIVNLYNLIYTFRSPEYGTRYF